MNFFGHAALAIWRSPDRAFVLGSMLPDFATMIGARPPLTVHAKIAAGMRFHRATDEAFHRCSVFRDLTHLGFGWLSARGVRRGSARAVAHIAVELLLDEFLASDKRAQRAYLVAVDGAAHTALGRHLSWSSNEERLRFGRLQQTLLARGEVSSDIRPELVAERLRRALAGRPRLAFDEAAELPIREWVAAMRPSIATHAVPLLHELTWRLAIS